MNQDMNQDMTNAIKMVDGLLMAHEGITKSLYALLDENNKLGKQVSELEKRCKDQKAELENLKTIIANEQRMRNNDTAGSGPTSISSYNGRSGMPGTTGLSSTAGTSDASSEFSPVDIALET